MENEVKQLLVKKATYLVSQLREMDEKRRDVSVRLMNDGKSFIHKNRTRTVAYPFTPISRGGRVIVLNGDFSTAVKIVKQLKAIEEQFTAIRIEEIRGY